MVALKYSLFRCSGRSDFHSVFRPSSALQTLPIRIFRSFFCRGDVASKICEFLHLLQCCAISSCFHAAFLIEEH